MPLLHREITIAIKIKINALIMRLMSLSFHKHRNKINGVKNELRLFLFFSTQLGRLETESL